MRLMMWRALASSPYPKVNASVAITIKFTSNMK